VYRQIGCRRSACHRRRYAPARADQGALAEDTYLAREGVARQLFTQSDLDVVAMCQDMTRCWPRSTPRPDVVLTDIPMPPTGTDEGIRAAERIRRTHPENGCRRGQPGAGAGSADGGSAGGAGVGQAHLAVP
jgi:CheY-like chemotaxis protein